MSWLKRLWYRWFPKGKSCTIVLNSGESVRIPYDFFEKGGKLIIEIWGAGGSGGSGKLV